MSIGFWGPLVQLTNVFGYVQHLIVAPAGSGCRDASDKRLAVGGLDNSDDAFQLALLPRLAVGSPLQSYNKAYVWTRLPAQCAGNAADAVSTKRKVNTLCRGSLNVGPERIDTVTELRWDGAPWLGAGLTGSFLWLIKRLISFPPNEYTNLPGG